MDLIKKPTWIFFSNLRNRLTSVASSEFDDDISLLQYFRLNNATDNDNMYLTHSWTFSSWYAYRLLPAET